MNLFDRNFWMTEISALGSWASLVYIEGLIGIITAVAAAVAAIVFAIKGIYDLKATKLEYRDKKARHDKEFNE